MINEGLSNKLENTYQAVLAKFDKIKSDFEKIVEEERNYIQEIKEKIQSFEDSSNSRFQSLMDEMPQEYVEAVKQMDSELKDLQESVAQLNGRLIRDKAMDNDVEYIKKHTKDNTQYFTENIQGLEESITGRRNLQREGLPSRQGLTRRLIRKTINTTKNLFSSNHKKDQATIDELGEIKKYHEELLAESEN
jgi:hypothetical protein